MRRHNPAMPRSSRPPARPLRPSLHRAARCVLAGLLLAAGATASRAQDPLPAAVQAALAAGPTAAELLPDLSDLPEFLPEAQFLARYGGIGAPAYQALLADIEARIGALALYR